MKCSTSATIRGRGPAGRGRICWASSEQFLVAELRSRALLALARQSGWRVLTSKRKKVWACLVAGSVALGRRCNHVAFGVTDQAVGIQCQHLAGEMAAGPAQLAQADLELLGLRRPCGLPAGRARRRRWAATAGHWPVQSPGAAASGRCGGSADTARLRGPSAAPGAGPGPREPVPPTRSATSPRCPGAGVRAPAATGPAGCPRLYRPGAAGPPVPRCGRRPVRGGAFSGALGGQGLAAGFWGLRA